MTWYKFRMNGTGTTAESVRIDFTHNQGDLDLLVYRADGTTLVGSSNGYTDSEEVSLDGQPAGTYYVEVYGYLGVFNPNYTLTITPAAAAAGFTVTPTSALTTTEAGGTATFTLAHQPANSERDHRAFMQRHN